MYKSGVVPYGLIPKFDEHLLNYLEVNLHINYNKVLLESVIISTHVLEIG